MHVSSLCTCLSCSRQKQSILFFLKIILSTLLRNWDSHTHRYTCLRAHTHGHTRWVSRWNSSEQTEMCVGRKLWRFLFYFSSQTLCLWEAVISGDICRIHESPSWSTSGLWVFHSFSAVNTWTRRMRMELLSLWRKTQHYYMWPKVTVHYENLQVLSICLSLFISLSWCVWRLNIIICDRRSQFTMTPVNVMSEPMKPVVRSTGLLMMWHHHILMSGYMCLFPFTELTVNTWISMTI